MQSAYCGARPRSSIARQFWSILSAIHTLMIDCRVTPRRCSLAVERVDHPEGEVDVDATHLPVGAPPAREVEVVDDVLDAVVELLVEVTRLS